MCDFSKFVSHSQSFEVGHGYFRDLMRYFHHGFIILLPKLNAIVTIKKNKGKIDRNDELCLCFHQFSLALISFAQA